MSNQQNTPAEVEIDLREELGKYLRHWPWFALCVIAALGATYFLLQLMTPVYSTYTTIMIKDGKESPRSELEAFSEMGLLGGMNTNSVENEIGILRSYRLMENVVKVLDLNVRYFEEGVFRSRELYTQSPVTAKIFSLDRAAMQELSEAEESSFSITFRGKGKLELLRLSDEKKFPASFDVPVDLGFARVIFSENKELSEEKMPEGRLLISFSLPEKTADAYEDLVSVQLKEKNSSLIELRMESPVREKAEDILDQLVREYNREAIEDKNLLAMNTAKFIDERLAIINRELETVETGKAEFKENNRLTDIQAESQLFMTSVTEYKKRRQELETQIELADAMLEYMENGSSNDLLPANLGISEEPVNAEIDRYNELVLERNRILSGSTPRNPVVVNLDRQIDQLKNNITHSLGRLRSNLLIARENLERETANIGRQIAAVPSKEKQYRNIERQQQIKETLYLFLLQKREENSLSLAATTPKAKIVDHARSSATPVSPKPNIMYLAALILGMLIPFLVIYLKQLLNNKIKSREDVEEMIKEVSIVGEIPKINAGAPELVQKNDRSMLAESYRILHHNLQYLLLRTKGKNTGVSIMVTSSIPGEGKTFTAFNLAVTLANAGKRTIVVGMDLRNPQMKRFMPESREYLGVSDYLVNPDLHLEDIIEVCPFHSNLHCLASGNIPPNPAELLGQAHLEQLIKELEARYDYVILDTAPCMPVVDTFLLGPYTDLTLYLVRAGHTEKKLLDFVVQARKEEKLGDLGIVLNNISSENFGYGNRYGYTYGEEVIPLWKRLGRKAAFWSL